MKRLLARAATALVIVFAAVISVGVFYAGAGGTVWYAELKQWQIGLGAFAGLIAILFGALYNADLMRDRDNRLRADEARAVARALAANLQSLAGILKSNSTMLSVAITTRQNVTREQVEVFSVPDAALLRVSPGTLGKLDSEVAYRVERVYGYIAIANSYLVNTIALGETVALDPDNRSHRAGATGLWLAAKRVQAAVDELEAFSAGRSLPPVQNFTEDEMEAELAAAEKDFIANRQIPGAAPR